MLPVLCCLLWLRAHAHLWWRADSSLPVGRALLAAVHPAAGARCVRPSLLVHPLPHCLPRNERRQLSFNELVALYAITDVALVTSLRDGMNLGAQHFGGV